MSSGLGSASLVALSFRLGRATALGAIILIAGSLSGAEEVRPPIVLGMSTALTGPTAHLGIGMRDGVLAGFAEANAAGGIQGRQLRLVALDDGYEPERTVPNMLHLIHEEQVLAIVGNMGTPTAVAAIPIATDSGTVFFGAYTGAGVLRRDPPNPYVINFRASYAEETVAMVNALIEFGGLRPQEVAFFTQRDAFGDAGFVEGVNALRSHGLESGDHVAHGRYERNSLAVENALADILLHPVRPRAVIIVGTFAPSVKFIRLARASGLKALMLNVSFVGAVRLAEGLGPDVKGAIVTQVVPHYESPLPIAGEYVKALGTLDPEAAPSFISFEGYVVARILCRALDGIRGGIDRESIGVALRGLGEFDIGLEEPLRLDEEEHQACHRVWSTIIREGVVAPFDWRDLGNLLKDGAP
ncbi:MAG: ABC transporter substrate-binding protein [bacterium]|nr:ABC transporter substrate-binding protein [bacterium]